MNLNDQIIHDKCRFGQILFACLVARLELHSCSIDPQLVYFSTMFTPRLTKCNRGLTVQLSWALQFCIPGTSSSALQRASPDLRSISTHSAMHRQSPGFWGVVQKHTHHCRNEGVEQKCVTHVAIFHAPAPAKAMKSQSDTAGPETTAQTGKQIKRM